MKKVKVLAIVAILGLVSCNTNTKKEGETIKETPLEQVGHTTNEAKYEVTELSYATSTKEILDAYFDLKEALQEDDAVEAQTAAADLLADLGTFTTTDEAVKTLIEKMKVEVEAMATEDIILQRAHFEPFSHQTKELLQKVGSDRIVFEQYCPMYKDNTGGMWLSEEEALTNPLFGAMMLRCGATKLEMKPIQ